MLNTLVPAPNSAMLTPDIREKFAQIRNHYSDVYVIVSPPRCSSTAFSRVFWEQPSVRYYSHEPFEVTYYDGLGLQDVANKLIEPLDLMMLKQTSADPQANALVIKEMPYQAGPNFPLLMELATHPVVFLMRDPRLNIASRIAKKQEAGQDPNFPLIETGWELLFNQIKYCRDENITHFIVDSQDFRNCPVEVFTKLFTALSLPFSMELLRWRSCAEVNLDNLAGHHSHLYEKVLGSTGLQPDRLPVPPIDSFPAQWQAHIEACLDIYRSLRRLPERISVS